MQYHILYNPLAGNGAGRTRAEALAAKLPESTVRLVDITRVKDYAAYFSAMKAGDRVILAGGDGTLHHFVRDAAADSLPEEILYAPTGTGNDFWTDIGRAPEDKPVNIRPYLENLPTVIVKDREYRFLNGIGYGIDGYCCLEGDRLREASRCRRPRP